MKQLICLSMLLALSSCGLKEMRREYLRNKEIETTLTESLLAASKASGEHELEFQFQTRNGEDASAAVTLFEAENFDVDYMSLPGTHKCLVLIYRKMSVDDQEALLAYIQECLVVSGETVKRFHGLVVDPES
jgi:hypothetical protein